MQLERIPPDEWSWSIKMHMQSMMRAANVMVHGLDSEPLARLQAS